MGARALRLAQGPTMRCVRLGGCPRVIRQRLTLAGIFREAQVQTAVGGIGVGGARRILGQVFVPRTHADGDREQGQEGPDGDGQQDDHGVWGWRVFGRSGISH